MKRAYALLALGLASNFVGIDSSHASDRDAGRRKVVVCQACHGLDGLSKNPEAPNLAGQLESYLIKSLQEYKSETRKNDSMNIVAKDLTDADIADVSAYYAAIQVEVIPP